MKEKAFIIVMGPEGYTTVESEIDKTFLEDIAETGEVNTYESLDGLIEVGVLGFVGRI